VFHSGVITFTATASAANKNTNPARFIRWITATLGILFVIAAGKANYRIVLDADFT
jgi:heme/copper-type cytochrome/quinol oxidase subunit 3